MRKFIRGRTTIGLRRAVGELRKEIRIQRIHSSSLKQAKEYSGSDYKLNVGCGPNRKDGWINLDLSKSADLRLDLREKLPFHNNSASIIYSEHFFEHLEYPHDAINFLKESLRVLKEGGLFSVGVPDTEWPIKSYANHENEYFQFAQQTWHPKWCNTRMHNLNYHFRQGQEHKYAYDYETLSQTLREAGFVSISKRQFDPTRDSEARKKGTLYIDAYKPNSRTNL
jgi:predicted SAM-dependent methyltransferase